MIESERWHWCEPDQTNTVQVVEVVQDVPWWACTDCQTLVEKCDDGDDTMNE